MAKIIRLPNGKEYQFPDDFPDEQISSAIDADILSNQPISQGGTPINQQSQDGSIAGGISLNQGQPGIPIQQSPGIPADQIRVSSGQSQIKSDQPANYNLFDRVASSAADGVSGTLGFLGDAINFLEDDEEKYQKSMRDRGYYTGPSGRSIREALSGTTARPTGSQDVRKDLLGFVPDAPFQSTEGRILGGAISGATSGLGVGGLGFAKLGALGGAAMQGAAEAGLPVGVQIAAGLLGGSAPGVAKNLLRRATSNLPSSGAIRKINQATQGITPEQFTRAEALSEYARQAGTPITGAEAIAQSLGGNNRLLDIQRLAEQSSKGAPILDRLNNQRSAANQNAIQNVLNKIGPEVQDTGALGANVQQSAENVLQNAKNQVNAAAKPLYDKATNPNNIIPDQLYNPIAKDDFLQSVIKEVRNDRLLGQTVRDIPDNSIAVLDLTKKRIDDLIETANRKGENNYARLLQQKKDQLISVADQAFPEYAQARSVYAQGIQNNVKPLENQPIGGLSQTGDFNKQAAIILDPKASNLTPSVAKSTIENLYQQNPEATQGLIRQALANHFAEANQKLVSGANQFGGAKFASFIQGNGKQSENLKALFSALPEGSATYNDFRRLLDVFEAQGKRRGVGSATEFNRQLSSEINQGGLISNIAEFSTVKPGGLLSNFIERVTRDRNGKQLANLLTDPQSVQLIRELRSTPANSQKAAVALFLLANLNKPKDQQQ
jgi:hypothetical protein